MLWGLTVSGILLALAIAAPRILSPAAHARHSSHFTPAATHENPGSRGSPHSLVEAPTPPAATAGGRTGQADPQLTGTPVSVSVATRPAGPVVGADFLGLSFELRSLPAIAGYAGRGNLVSLLRSLGPGVLRFGGVSADEQAAWVARGATRPGWATTAITEADLAGLAGLARASGWRVLLTVNLGHYNPPAAAQEAAAAQRLLGASLAGVEIGNEPDLYVRKHMRSSGWDLAAYVPQAAAYRAAIRAAAPGVPLAGPDPSTGVAGLRWVRATAASPTLRPALLTDHYYPLSSCGYRPTISELLSPNVRRAESEALGNAVAIAHAHATPLRIDEANSISCEGQPGVSNTFASALWALDYAARAIAAGVAGLNLHDLLDKPGAYSPLIAPSRDALAAGALHAAPEWYALLAAHALGGDQAGWRPLHAHVAGAAAGALSASAVRAPDGQLRLVLVDYAPPGSPPLAVHLRVSRGLARGSVLRLTAPSPAATAGVRLGGRAVAPNGTWTPPSALPQASGRAGSLAVQIAPSSAAVVMLTPTGLLGHEAFRH